MKIVLIGIGLLGSEFDLLLKNSSNDYYAFNYPEIDITNPDSLTNSLDNLGKIDYLINCAAYTAVDKAEVEKELVRKINVVGTKNLAEYCRDKDITLVHFSTDYIFNGQKTEPYLETDPTDPINYYGVTKLESENHVINLLKKYYIFRVQWLYGQFGPSFISKILEITKTRKEIEVVADQWGTPTWAKQIAQSVLGALEKQIPYGIYNFTNLGVATWYEFAQVFLKYLKIDVPINPVTSERFKTLAQRPKNSRLNIQKFLNLNLQIPDHWENALIKYLKQREEGEQ